MEVQLVVASGNKAGQTIPIQGPKFLIGRADDCHLKPRSELISRYHCAIISEDGYVAIRDLGSKNGVYLNGERVPLESELKNGDKLSVGPLEFVVNLSIRTKIPKKPRVNSIEAAVVRTVEIEEEQAKKAVEQVQPVLEQPPPPPRETVQSEVVKQEPVVEKTLEKVFETLPEAMKKTVADDSSPGLRVEDWLLGSSDSSLQDQETKTAQAPRPSTVEVFVPEHEETKSQDEAEKTTDREEKEDKSSKFGVKKAASSRDAAANLLKSFFKGGR